MARPTWLAYAFAFVMVAVSLYCLAWLIVARRRSNQNHVDVNVSHVAMGMAMAGTLVPRLNVVPDGVWEAVFVAIALWFSYQAIGVVIHHVGRTGLGGRHALSHSLIHLVMALAMLYMFLAALPAATGAGAAVSMTAPTGAGANFVGLPLLFVVALLASAAFQLDGLSRYAPAGRSLVRAGAGADVGPTTDGGHAVETAAPSPGEAPRPWETVGAPSQWIAPRVEMGCHIVMCITMGYMLVLML